MGGGGGGCEEGRKICWVKWDVVCKPREEGGLGIKNIRVFNLALLGNWRWRLLTEKESLWARVLRVRYGDPSSWRAPVVSVFSGGRLALAWWCDLGKLESSDTSREGWLSAGITNKIGNGLTTSFWFDHWVGLGSLACRFGRLFGISIRRQATVSEMGVWREGVWEWKLSWRRASFDWEKELVLSLHDLLNSVSLSLVRQDGWCWLGDDKSSYTVQSTYQLLTNTAVRADILVYNLVWDRSIPLKVGAFSWRAILNRILPAAGNLLCCLWNIIMTLKTEEDRE